jgi:hypothetical protein
MKRSEPGTSRRSEHTDGNRTTRFRASHATRLFVPCVSNAFLQALDGDLLHHEPLGRALQAPAFAILPIVVRPVETGANFPARPLCLYEGAALEMVCKEYASLIEESVRDLCADLCSPQTGVDVLFQSPATVQPIISSQRTTTDLLSSTLEPLKRLLEQTSAQVVESQQLAIAERSQRRAIAQDAQGQIEELRKQVEAIETAQQASFFTKLRRRRK